MSTVYSMVCGNGQTAGSFFDLLPLGDKSRYGEPGNYRCYGGLEAWFTDRKANSSTEDTEVCEIADAFIDSLGDDAILFDSSFPAYAVEVTTSIRGVRSAAFHNGSIVGCYIAKSATGYSSHTINIERSRITVDGLCLENTTQGACLKTRTCAFTVLKNNIAKASQYAFSMQGTAEQAFNNIGISTSSVAFFFNTYGNTFSTIYNNLAIDSKDGFKSGGTGCGGSYYNNVAFNCTTNWGTIPAILEDARNNAGISTDAPWDSGTTAIKTLVAGDFDGYAPASASSQLVDAGITLIGMSDTDMLGGRRPSYVTGNDIADIGPIEWDYGNTPPNLVDITLTNIVDGSMVIVEKVSDGSDIISPVMAGVTGIIIANYGYTSDTNVVIRVRKSSESPKYKPFKTFGTITDTGLSVFISQVPDNIAS